MVKYGTRPICGRIPFSPSPREILFDSKVNVTIYLPCIRKDGNGIDFFQGVMQKRKTTFQRRRS
jgi:hypothetical protein